MLSGQTRHELSCAACGAPLHDLKALRSDKTGGRHLLSPGKPAGRGQPARPPKPVKKKKAKRKKGLMARVLDEAFDLVEDIFD